MALRFLLNQPGKNKKVTVAFFFFLSNAVEIDLKRKVYRMINSAGESDRVTFRFVSYEVKGCKTLLILMLRNFYLMLSQIS